MALVEFRQPAARFSGRTGVAGDGQVYYVFEGRGIARTLIIPTNPRSGDQQLIRSLQTSLAGQYKALNRSEADAWNAFGRNFTMKDRLGRDYSFGGIQAFLAVNTQRVLAGAAAVAAPPAYANTPSPLQITGANAGAGHALSLTLQHQLAAGAARWRLRLTPALGSNVRLASPTELRHATPTFAGCYVAVAASPQTLNLTTKYSYSTGDVIGVEIMGLSNDYVPGQVLFHRHITLD